jgi:O-antigen/teichoic acid export membrane protein
MKFSAPLVVGSVGIYVVDNFAKWYFIYNDDIVSLGYYSFLYSVSQQVVGTLMFVLYSIELPNIVRAYDRKRIDAIFKHKRLLLSAYMIVLLGITMSYFFFEEIVYIAGLSNYSGYSFVSSVIAAAVWLGCFRSFYLDLYFMLTKSTKYVMYVSLIGGFVSVSVGFILIPEYKLNGAALTQLLVFMMMSASSYYLVKRLS